MPEVHMAGESDSTLYLEGCTLNVSISAGGNVASITFSRVDKQEGLFGWCTAMGSDGNRLEVESVTVHVRGVESGAIAALLSGIHELIKSEHDQLREEQKWKRS